MIQTPMDVLRSYEVRKTKAQKERFRKDAAAFLQGCGYQTSVERTAFGAKNLVAGDPEKAKILITAHYDTCAGMLIPALITPCNFFLFWMYQLAVAVLLLLIPALIALAVGYFGNGFVLPRLVFAILALTSTFLMMAGPANRHNANDNTSGVVTVLEIAKSMPDNLREKVCFVLFDLEELGLVGSAGHRKAHKAATANQLVLNLDCVGEGDEILFFPTKKLKKQPATAGCLQKAVGTFGQKRISMRTKGFSVYPSDQKSFPLGVGIAALKKGRWGLYLDRIHTRRDTVLDQTNVNLLRAAIITVVDNAAV